MFLFVGECPSETAKRRGWSWADGRLAAKQLFDALVAIGIEPKRQDFVNLFSGPACRVRGAALRKLRSTRRVVVALGSKVQSALRRKGIAFRPMIHPAARGKIRLKQRYADHVRSVLLQPT